MHFRTVALAILAWQSPLQASQPQDPRPTSDPNTELLRKLSQAAGLPSPRNHPFVEIHTGSFSRTGNDEPIPILAFGILLDDNGRQFRALNTRFQEVIYERAKKGAPKIQQVKYKPIDPQPMLTRRLREEPSWDGIADLYYGWLADGLDQQPLAEQLLDRVVRCHKHRSNGNSFATAATIDLGFARYEDVAMAFEAKHHSDDTRLARLDRWLTAFPEHELRAEVQSLREALARSMQRQPTSDATSIERYIHELTSTETGISVSGGWPFVMPVHGGTRPADKLFMLGVEAAPALLAAMDDDRPSRTVRYAGRRSHRSEIMRVDRIATQVLDAIAGLGIAHLDPKAAKPRLAAWYRRVQANGATAELVARAKTGDQAACQRLLDVAPELLADAVAIALPTMDNDYQKKHLMQLVARTESAGARKLLRAALRSDDGVAIANVAPELLRQPAHRGVALQALVRAWRQVVPGSDAARAIGPLLCAHGNATTLLDLAKKPLCLTGPELQHLRQDMQKDELGADYANAVEQLLRQLLAYEHGLRNTHGGTLDPRLCDFAAAELAKRWPQRFAFDFSQLRTDRDRALRQLRHPEEGNQANQRPSSDRLRRIDEALTAWHAENLPSQRDHILARITDPVALTPLRATRTKVFKRRRQELDAACSRLAATVVSVGPKHELDKLAGPLRERFVAMQQEPFDANAFAALLGDLTKTPTEGIAVQSFEVMRATNDTGVTVRLRSEPGNSAIRKHPQYRVAFAFDGKVLQDATGSGVRRSVAATAFTRLARHLSAALDQPDRTAADGASAVSPAIEVRVELRQRD